MTTTIRSLRVVIEMPDYDQLQWLDEFFRSVKRQNGKIGSWGIMEEEID